MDPMSVAASLTALVQLTAKVAQLLKDIKGGSEDRIRLREEIRSTLCLLQMLQDRVEDAEVIERDLLSIKSLNGPGGPLEQLLHALEQLAAKVTPNGRLSTVVQALLWPVSKQEVHDLIGTIERQKTAFNVAMQNDNIGLSLAIKDQVNEVSGQMSSVAFCQEVMHDDFIDERCRRVLNWLCNFTFGSRQSDIVNTRAGDTGKWLLESAEFIAWQQGQENVLWCHGIPGAGKTVLASVIIKHLQRTFDTRDNAVIFLYCNYKERAQQTANNLIASLIRQLEERHSSITDDLQSLYNRHAKHGTRPSRSELLEHLSTIASKFPSLAIVIDALDECNATDGTTRVLSVDLRDILHTARFLFTSRPLIEIERGFDGCSRLEIRANNDDIRQYISHRLLREARLAKHIEADKNLAEVISDTITRKSDGMFLLAQLHLGALATKHSRKALKSALATLPVKLDDTYEETMQRISNQTSDDASLARNVLLWICLALRPLSLVELQHALAAMDIEGDDELEDEDLPDGQILISVCAGLVTLDSESNTVRLVHYTTQEYFERNPLRPTPSAQVAITQSLIAYLSLRPLQQGPCADNEALEQRFQRYPLLRYASQNWGTHARGLPESSCKDKILQLLSSNPLLASVSQAATARDDKPPSLTSLRWSQVYRTQISVLSAVAIEGLTSIVEHLLGQGVDFEEANDFGATALILAAQRGHPATIKALLKAGANIHRADVSGKTALITAAGNGHEAAVAALLGGKPNVEAQTVQDYTALFLAVRFGHQCTALLLLDAGADIEAKCNINAAAVDSGNSDIIRLISQRTTTALTERNMKSSVLDYMWSNRGGQTIEVIDTLIKEGGDINYRSDDGDTPLHLAAQKGFMEPVNIFLGYGVDPNTRSLAGNTPLHWAAFRGDPQIVNVLLVNGAEIAARNNAGETALHTCMYYECHSETIHLLLNQGAAPDAANSQGQTALHLAARRGYWSIVQCLLKNGADINKKDDQGWTALQYGAAAGHEDVVMQLLDHKPILCKPNHHTLLDSALLRDAIAANDTVAVERFLSLESINVDISSHMGKTALHHAAYNGMVDVVKRLLERGASVNSRIPDHVYWHWVTYEGHILDEAYECAWITPLHNAAGNGHTEVTEILLDAGADVHAAGGEGYTPLSVAVYDGHIDVVRLLLSHGADVHRLDSPQGPSQLFWAVQKGYEDIARLLLEHGAGEEPGSLPLSRALALAVDFKFTGVVELMRSYGFITGQR